MTAATWLLRRGARKLKKMPTGLRSSAGGTLPLVIVRVRSHTGKDPA